MITRLANSFVAGLLVLALVWISSSLGGAVIVGAALGAGIVLNLAFVIGEDQ